MSSLIPEKLKQNVKAKLCSYTGSGQLEITDFRFSSGGCINRAGRLRTSEGDFFIKWNSKSQFGNMFNLEKSGLEQLLGATHSLKVAKPIDTGDDGENAFLLLEYIDSGPRKSDFWDRLGVGLAELHRNTNDQFGLNEDNYIGSLVQKNGWNSDWLNFFISNRLEFMFARAFDVGFFSQSERVALNNLANKLESLCPQNMVPSLLHGDLWSGNFMVSEDGGPCLIDPAVYYGFREIELAFTELFGGFDEEFYRSYEENWPLEPGYETRKDIWNLYPLLVHVNLFGASYEASVTSIIRKFR